MVGIHYEELKIRQQEIEVKALVAMYENTDLYDVKRKCEAKLFSIAFPESLAEKINKEQTKL
jgi:hypothetical protein